MNNFFKKVAIVLIVFISLYLIIEYFLPSNCLEDEVELTLDTHLLCVEIADTDEKREKGLMFRKTLDKHRGILFVFDHPQILKFWMKDTEIPLEIGFFDKHKYLMEYKSMEPFSLEAVSSSDNALYALEVNKDWFQSKKVKIGSKFHLSKKKF